MDLLRERLEMDRDGGRSSHAAVICAARCNLAINEIRSHGDLGMTEQQTQEWSGSPCPLDPDNFWIDDETGERVNAETGERTPSLSRD